MTYRPDNAVTWIVIHYSATPIERDFSAQDIDDMHRIRGFKEIGYHYYIRKSGEVEKGRDMDQPGRFEQGAHSKGENAASIGICYEGGVSASAPNVGYDTRTHAQKVAMEALILTLLDRFPGAIVEGHRDMPGAATQCPGFNAREWWAQTVARRAAEANKVPDAVKEVATDADKSWWQSKQVRTVLFGWATSAYAFWQAADTETRLAIGALSLMLLYIFADRIRKSKLGRKAVDALGL